LLRPYVRKWLEYSAIRSLSKNPPHTLPGTYNGEGMQWGTRASMRDGAGPSNSSRAARPSRQHALRSAAVSRCRPQILLLDHAASFSCPYSMWSLPRIGRATTLTRQGNRSRLIEGAGRSNRAAPESGAWRQVCASGVPGWESILWLGRFTRSQSFAQLACRESEPLIGQNILSLSGGRAPFLRASVLGVGLDVWLSEPTLHGAIGRERSHQ
jgi:hypothetical protein